MMILSYISCRLFDGPMMLNGSGGVKIFVPGEGKKKKKKTRRSMSSGGVDRDHAGTNRLQYNYGSAFKLG
jgi:hypothetical protein